MSITTVDDRDSPFTYSPAGNWGQMGVKEENDGTTSFTSIAGSKSTVTFTGTQISIFGTISPNGTGSAPSSSYSIDGSAPQVFNGAQLSEVQYRQLFFRSSLLSAGTHALTITSLTDQAYLWIDYAEVVVPPPQISSSSSSTLPIITTTSTHSSNTPLTITTSSTILPSSNSGNTTPSLISSSSDITVSSSSSNAFSTSLPTTATSSNSSDANNGTAIVESHKSSKSGIIGGVVAAFIVFILILLFFMWRRRNSKRKIRGIESHLPGTGTRTATLNSGLSYVTPFVDDPSRGRYESPVNQMLLVSQPAPASEGSFALSSNNTSTGSPTSDGFASFNNTPNIYTPPGETSEYGSKRRPTHTTGQYQDNYTNPPPQYEA